MSDDSESKGEWSYRSGGDQEFPDIDELPSCDFQSVYSPNTSPISSISSDDELFPEFTFQNVTKKTESNCIVRLDFEDSSFVSLTELDAILNTPPSAKCQKHLKPQNTPHLETIYEGKFLDTPPKKSCGITSNHSIKSMENFKENVQTNT